MRGLLNWYEGGGYAMMMGRTQQSAADAINYLQENNWIDKETRTVFIEFTLYNTQINLYSVSFIKFELLNTGGELGSLILQPYRKKFFFELKFRFL